MTYPSPKSPAHEQTSVLLLLLCRNNFLAAASALSSRCVHLSWAWGPASGESSSSPVHDVLPGLSLTLSLIPD